MLPADVEMVNLEELAGALVIELVVAEGTAESELELSEWLESLCVETIV